MKNLEFFFDIKALQETQNCQCFTDKLHFVNPLNFLFKPTTNSPTSFKQRLLVYNF